MKFFEILNRKILFFFILEFLNFFKNLKFYEIFEY